MTDRPQSAPPPVGFSTPRRSRKCSCSTSINATEEDELLRHNQSQSSSQSVSDEENSDKSTHCHIGKTGPDIDRRARRKLIIASVLSLMFMIAEIVGGVLAHSLAIVSDAAHLLTDLASFLISLLAIYLASRRATKKLSFGWYRAEILGALTSILMLWVITAILVYMGIERIIDDNYEINATIMLITAGCGVAFNIVMGCTLHQHGHAHAHQDNEEDSSNGSSDEEEAMLLSNKENSSEQNHSGYGTVQIENGNTKLVKPVSKHSKGHNINVKAAFVHVLGDFTQSVGVLIAALIIFFKPEWKIADPICTFVFSVIVLITTFTIMRDILIVLMEGTPRGMNFKKINQSFFDIPGVKDVHDLRIWSLSMNKIALSAHLAVASDTDPLKVLKLVTGMVQRRFGIQETTIQIEEYVDDMLDCTHCQDLPD